jgi:C4-dicarboxylate-specific signal transduction histidine kinase
MTKPTAEAWRSVSEEGLRFFGEMSASVSHEIRNKLAVINEKAGLIQDIAQAVKSGRSIDPDRLDMQAGKIVDQIRQANQIVGALNRLAHSVDASGIKIDLGSVVGLVVELYRRKAAQAEVTIDTTGVADTVSVVTSPFLLEDLIGACLNVALVRVDESRTIKIVAGPSTDGAVVRFQNLAGIDDSDVELGGEIAGVRVILGMLGGRVAADGRNGELVLEVGNRERYETGSQL